MTRAETKIYIPPEENCFESWEAKTEDGCPAWKGHPRHGCCLPMHHTRRFGTKDHVCKCGDVLPAGKV